MTQLRHADSQRLHGNLDSSPVGGNLLMSKHCYFQKSQILSGYSLQTEKIGTFRLNENVFFPVFPILLHKLSHYSIPQLPSFVK